VKIYSAADVAKALPYRALIEALRHAFQSAVTTPVRHHHAPLPTTTLLLMPAWSKDWTGIKTVTVKSDNPNLNLPTVQGSYLLINNATGAPVAVMDGTELTRRRTAAASALAADYLARKDAKTLALFGAGALAQHFVEAHAAVRDIKSVRIVNRNSEKAKALAATLCQMGFDATATTAEAAVKEADIISCITSSTTALFKGEWLKAGTHVDLAGAFTPKMRETDGITVHRSAVYVDTYEGAMAEAGDLLQAESEGHFRMDSIQADLAELTTAAKVGRVSDEQITLFKSCGTALEDLAAAILVQSSSA
jgi:ornithine cyclodeaminase/alanine dehydrogenase-like protein (mu-crystallin family)